MSQQELADNLGISRQMISYIEADKSGCGLDKPRKREIAKILHMDVRDLTPPDEDDIQHMQPIEQQLPMMTTPIGDRPPATFRERLVKLQDASDYSNSELAYRIGCSESGYQKLRGGITALPNAMQLLRLAETFGVSPHYLMCVTDDPTSHAFAARPSNVVQFPAATAPAPQADLAAAIAEIRAEMRKEQLDQNRRLDEVCQLVATLADQLVAQQQQHSRRKVGVLPARRAHTQQ